MPAALAIFTLIAASASAQPEPAPHGPELVDLLREDPVALDLIHRDAELLKTLNRRPTITQVVQELRTDPSVFWYRIRKTLSDPWVLFGFGAQFLFFMRFIIQWIASERKKRSHIPVAFWYFSLAGGLTLFAYAVRRLDPVFMLGQGLGCLIYIRNLVLIRRRSAEYKARLANRKNGQSDNDDAADGPVNGSAPAERIAS